MTKDVISSREYLFIFTVKCNFANLLYLMKITGKISDLLRMVTLMIGLMSISISVFEYRIEDRIQDELEIARQKEDPDQDAGDQNFLPDYQATISSFQLHLENVPSMVGFAPVLTSVRDWVQIRQPLTEINFFRTLFQHIIAPNAP
jgi:hypothetical protein